VSFRYLLSATALALFLSGCSTVDSASIPANPAPPVSVSTAYSPGSTAPPEDPGTTATPRAISPGNTEGIAYFLPRQLAKVTAKRSEVALSKAIEALGKAELASSVAKAQVAAAEGAVAETENALVAKGDIPAIRDLLTARLAAQKKDLADAKAGSATADSNRATARKAVSDLASRPPASGDADDVRQYKVTVDIELLPPSADPAHGYRLSPRHSAFRDDEQKLAVAPNGLLTSVDIVAADRTADALVELATFAGAITSGMGRSLAQTKCSAVPEEMSAVVDFTNADEVATLNRSLNCMGANILIQGAPEFPVPVHYNSVPVAGIVYRTPIEILLRIEKCETGKCKDREGWFPTQTIALSLPQAGPISTLPQNAGLFTRTTYGTVFKDGILTSYNSNRPSEILEVARTPMRVLNGVFDGASKVISLRTGQINARAGLVNSETSLQQARTALLIDALSRDKKLTDQQLINLQSAIALQTGQANGQVQLSAADLAAMQALLHDQARKDAINKCIGEKVTAGEPIDTCLVTP